MLLIKRSFCMPITFDSIPNLSLSFFGLSYIWVLSNFQYNGVFATSSWISIHFRQGLLAHDLLIFFFFLKAYLIRRISSELHTIFLYFCHSGITKNERRLL